MKRFFSIFHFQSSIFLFATCYLLNSTLSYSQTPEWVYQHESPYPNAIAVDSAGNTYTTGCIALNDTNGLGVIALNVEGTLRWLSFNDTLANWAYGNDISYNSRRIYVAGYAQFLGGNMDLIVLCVDTSGHTEWIYRDTSAFEANAVAVSQSHYVYAAGFTRISSLDIIVLKLDSLGNEVWRYVYDGPAGSYDEATSIAIDKNENIYVGGYSTGGGTSTDFTVIKLDSAGNERWVYRYDGPASYRDELKVLVLDSLGNIYMTGWSWGIDWDFCVVKIDTAGEEKWVYRYNGQANIADNSEDLVVDDSGNVYVGGASCDDTVILFTVIKVDSSGQEWWRYLSAGPWGKGGGVVSLVFGGQGVIYAGGGFWNLAYRGQIALVKLSSAGESLWTYVYPHQPVSPGTDCTRDVVIDAVGNVYLAGQINVSTWDDDIVVMKFASPPGGAKEVVCNITMNKNPKATIFKGGIEFLPEENCGVRVYDATGRLVVDQTLCKGSKYFHPLPSGVYFLRFNSECGLECKKVVVY